MRLEFKDDSRADVSARRTRAVGGVFGRGNSIGDCHNQDTRLGRALEIPDGKGILARCSVVLMPKPAKGGARDSELVTNESYVAFDVARSFCVRQPPPATLPP